MSMDSLPIVLTPAALTHLQKQQGAYWGIQILLKKTGCAGYQYQAQWIFEKAADDLVFEYSGLPVVVGKKDWPFLRGLEIDYQKRGLNRTLVFNSPKASAACGCGLSVKFD